MDEKRQPPQITATKTLARSNIFHIEAVDLQFSNGEQRQFERLVQHRPAVMIAAMLDNDTVLLAREYAVGVERYEIGLPKGAVDPGESIIAATNRELQEELGYAARQLHHLRDIALAPGYLTHSIALVIAQDLYPSQLTGDEPEAIEVVPWQLSQLNELLARNDCTESRSIAGLFLLREYLSNT